MPSVVASLRAVREEERSLALGLQSIILRCVGSIPGPILFGVFMDKACSLWEQTCGKSLSLSPPIIFFRSQRNEVPVCCMTTTRWLCPWYNKYGFPFKETIAQTLTYISGWDISHGQDHLNPLLHPRLLLQSPQQYHRLQPASERGRPWKRSATWAPASDKRCLRQW